MYLPALAATKVTLLLMPPRHGINRLTTLAAIFGIAFGLTITPAQADTPRLGTFSPVVATWGVGFIELTPPTSTSSGAWSFSIADEAIAKVVGNMASILAVGTTTITATQAADGVFDSRRVSTTLTVQGATPTLGEFSNLELTLGSKPMTLTPPTSNSAGTWSFASSNPSVVNVQGNLLTVVGLGEAAITATQSANWNWASVSKSAVVTVTGGVPTIGPFLDLTLTLGSVSSITLVPPTSQSQGGWTFLSANPDVARISGTTLTPVKVGKVEITAIQEASGSFASATKSMTVTVLGPPPTIGEFAAISATLEPFGDNRITLTPPISNSTGVWIFRSLDKSIVDIEGSVAILKGRGATSIAAVQAPSEEFGGSSEVITRFVVRGAVPTFEKWLDSSVKYGDGSFRITPPVSSSGGRWIFESLTPAILRVVGDQATPLSLGRAVIKATQEANWNWESATTQTFIDVTGVAPFFETATALELPLNGAAISIVPPRSNSQGSWRFVAADPSLLRVEGDKVVGLAVGKTTILAIQEQYQGFEESSPIALDVSVKPIPTITANSPVRYVFGEVVTPLTQPLSNSTGSWSYTSSDESILTINGNLPTVRKVGVVQVIARQSSTAEFVGAEIVFEVRVLATSPERTWNDYKIKFSNQLIPIQQPTSTSNGAWVYQVAQSDVASIEGDQLRVKKAGKVTITATQAAEGNYSAASVMATITIEPTVAVALNGRTISINVGGASAKVTINGTRAKVGKNKVGPGKRTVRVVISGNEVYKKTFNVK